jgi:hypothetical protein
MSGLDAAPLAIEVFGDETAMAMVRQMFAAQKAPLLKHFRLNRLRVQISITRRFFSQDHFLFVIRNFPALHLVSFGDDFICRSEKFAFWKFEQAQKAALRLLVSFECPVCENVENIQPAKAQVRRDQDAAVAIQRILLSAHQRDTHPCRTLDNAVNAMCERGCARDQSIVRPAFHITFTLRPSRAQFAPEKQINDTIVL